MTKKRLDIWAVVVSGVALVVAIISCIVSIQSNRISEKALLVTNRPYLILQPVKHPDTDSFIEITTVENQHSRIKVLYQVHNAGSTPAQDIAQAQHILIGGVTPSSNAPLQVKPLPEVTLGPGQKRNIALTLHVRADSQAIEAFEKGQRGIEAQLVLFYSSGIAKDQKFKSSAKYRLTREHSVLLNAEM